MKRVVLVGLACLVGCNEDRSAGTASQTGNSVVAGRILKSDSLPARNVEVTLTPATWGGYPTRSLRTDSLGGYRFDAVDSGLWMLESHGDQTSVVRTLRLRAGRDSTLPPLFAKQEGAVVVEIHLDDTLRKAKLAVMGRDGSWTLASPGFEVFVTIAELAPGSHWFSIVGPDGRELREAAFTVRSGKLDTLKNFLWKRESKGASEDDELLPEAEEFE